MRKMHGARNQSEASARGRRRGRGRSGTPGAAALAGTTATSPRNAGRTVSSQTAVVLNVILLTEGPGHPGEAPECPGPGESPMREGPGVLPRFATHSVHLPALLSYVCVPAPSPRTLGRSCPSSRGALAPPHSVLEARPGQSQTAGPVGRPTWLSCLHVKEVGLHSHASWLEN